MSMPEFPVPNPELTRDQALNMILSSIAMEELALSHILNAEGEKIQYVLGNSSCKACAAETGDVLAVNESVTNLMEMVMQNQLILKNKMKNVLEYLPKPAPPVPPCPPPTPCPCQCKPDCPHQYKPYACFTAIPGMYHCGSAVQWQLGRIGSCCRFGEISTGCSSIRLPRTGWFKVSFFLEFCAVNAEKGSEMLELLIISEKKPISKVFYPKPGLCQTTITGDTVIPMPCSCSPCHASLLVRLSGGVQIQQGELSFDRIV